MKWHPAKPSQTRPEWIASARQQPLPYDWPRLQLGYGLTRSIDHFHEKRYLRSTRKDRQLKLNQFCTLDSVSSVVVWRHHGGKLSSQPQLVTTCNRLPAPSSAPVSVRWLGLCHLYTASYTH